MTAEEVVRTIITEYRGGNPLFADSINVEDFALKVGGNIRPNFIFFVVLLDASMRSEVLYNGALKYLKDHGENAFESKYILGLKDLPDILQTYLHVRYPTNAAKYWKNSAKQLQEQYKGDSKKIFSNNNSAIEILRIIESFNGYGPKKASLLLRTVVNLYDYKYGGMWDLPMPIDRHKFRLTHVWGLISDKDYEKKDIAQVSKIWKDACKKEDVNWWEFDRAFWLYATRKGNIIKV